MKHRQNGPTGKLLRKKGVRHTSVEKAKLVNYFDQERNIKGRTAAQVATEVGVSRGTLHRWRREQGFFEPCPAPLSSTITIEEAIARLTKQGSKNDFLEAVFYFIAWLHFPTRVQDHALAVTSCITAYFHQKLGAQTLYQLNEEDRELLFRYIRLDVLARMCSANFCDFPSFHDVKLYGQPYSDRDAMAETAMFLLWSAQNLPEPMSLNKAYFMLSNGAFEYVSFKSLKTFRKIWAQHGPAAPFLFVEQFASNLDWILDPEDETFSASIDELLKHRREVRQYFEKCMWAVQVFEGRMDQRSKILKYFPKFPTKLKPIVIQIDPLSAEAIVVLNEYKKAYKYMF